MRALLLEIGFNVTNGQLVRRLTDWNLLVRERSEHQPNPPIEEQLNYQPLVSVEPDFLNHNISHLSPPMGVNDDEEFPASSAEEILPSLFDIRPPESSSDIAPWFSKADVFGTWLPSVRSTIPNITSYLLDSCMPVLAHASDDTPKRVPASQHLPYVAPREVSPRTIMEPIQIPLLHILGTVNPDPMISGRCSWAATDDKTSIYATSTRNSLYSLSSPNNLHAHVLSQSRQYLKKINRSSLQTDTSVWSGHISADSWKPEFERIETNEEISIS